MISGESCDSEDQSNGCYILDFFQKQNKSYQTHTFEKCLSSSYDLFSISQLF